MKKRIGNDITFTWHIFRKSGETQTPESFAGKEVEVKLISPLQRPVAIEDVSIATGVVTFTFRGKHQVTLGNYVAVLQENRGEDGMVTLDVVSAVTLVPHSYMEEDGDDGDVIEAEAVELTSTISADSGGGIEQQQADWAQTDDTAVDYIKNKPNLDVYCRKDMANVHTGGYDQYIKDFGESVGNVAIDAQQLWVRLLYPNGELVSETRVGPGNIRITKNGVTLNLNPAYFQALVEAINGIEAVIPEQASSSNQLADKNFVNSSIATNTANYISDNGQPFQSLEDLESYSGVLTNNDYAFVVGVDSAGNITYSRYKYNASTQQWALEYVLNNSSFTAEQWAAINSSITSGLVAKLSALPTNSELTTLLNGKVDKIEGKGLSTNDYTDSDKEKVSSISLPGATYSISRNQWILDGNIATNSEGVLKIEATAFLTPTIVDGRLVLTRNRPHETPYFKIYSPFEGTLRIRCYEWVDSYTNWRLELGYLTDYPEKYHYLEPFYESSDNTDIAIYVKAGWNTIRGGSGNSNNAFIIGEISLQKGILALNSRVTEHNMGLMTPQHLSDLNNKVDKVTGKGLSANDYTTADKDKLNALPTATELTQELGSKANSADLASVATTGSYNDLSDKPDLSAFITNSVDNLVNYYLKSETYTKNEVLQLIGALQMFHYEIYPERPQSGAGNVLYLIGPTGTGTDKYEEYVYANNDWTKIGDTSIDLSGYVTTQALNTALAGYVTSSALSTALANYYNKTEVDGLLSGKADKSEMSVVPGTGANADKTTITLKQGTSATVLTAHQDISGKEDVTTIVTPVNATDATLPITTLTCEVGKYYRIDVAVDTLAVTLPAMTDLTTVKTVVIYLTGGTTHAITISSADSKDVYYQDGFEIDAGNTYEINALFNGAAWIVAAVKINVE